MSARSLLGPADVPDETLLAYAAARLGVDPLSCNLVGSSADVVDYALDTITTGGRWWVTVDVRTPEGERHVRFFVKLVQSWSRSPHFQEVPPEFRDLAERSVPWRTEPLIYRSDLVDRLPPGLTMVTAVDVRFLDDWSAAIWLPEVSVGRGEWPVERFAHAARLLGRLAASTRVQPLAAIGEEDGRRGVRSYAEGRLALQVGPMLRDDGLWMHPALASAFGPDLRGRLLSHLDQVPGYVSMLEAAPEGTAHGDACPNNLLVQADSSNIVLIDYGFWSTQPFGFDLCQLIVGDVQVGRRPAAELAALEAACTPAYVEGLRDEGCDVTVEVVRRAHALQFLIFTGLSSFLFAGLQGPSTPAAHALAAERAAIARFSVDFADATA